MSINTHLPATPLKWRDGKIPSHIDDKFSTTPIPGYTGYIPRSHEHFSKAFSQSTQDALEDFQRMSVAHREEPKLVQHLKTYLAKPNKRVEAVIKGYPEQPPVLGETSPYTVPTGHPNQKFMAGYTGFVPRHQKFHGKVYDQSCRYAIQDFLGTTPAAQPMETVADPIPGFTGFLPGSKYAISSTFGKATKTAFMNRNVPAGKDDLKMQLLDRSVNKPIAGYKGHISAHGAMVINPNGKMNTLF